MRKPSKLVCLNCNNNANGHYCGRCGQSTETRRLDAEWLLGHLSEVTLHLSKSKLLCTFSTMLLDPGRLVLDYIAGRRVNWHPPISYLLLSAIIYKLLLEWILKKNSWEAGRFAHMSYLQMLLAFAIISLLGYFLVLRPRYNFIESVVTVCYIYGTVFLVAPILAILIQAPFPTLASDIDQKFRPLIVDVWSILLGAYMAIRIVIKMEASLFRLTIVTLLTVIMYYFNNISAGW